MKRKIRLTESDLHRIVKESVNRILRGQIICEGEKWIGSFNLKTFDKLRRFVSQMNGKCSFELNNNDFTIIYVSPKQR